MTKNIKNKTSIPNQYTSLYYFSKSGITLYIGKDNTLRGFKGACGYFRLHTQFKNASLRKAIKISNPKATFKESSNLDSINNAQINLNQFIGLNVFKSGLMSRLKSIAGPYTKI